MFDMAYRHGVYVGYTSQLVYLDLVNCSQSGEIFTKVVCFDGFQLLLFLVRLPLTVLDAPLLSILALRIWEE